MVNLRRQRSKGESTFLELVKAQLHQVQEELIQIKVMIGHLLVEPKLAPPPAPPPLDTFNREFLLCAHASLRKISTAGSELLQNTLPKMHTLSEIESKVQSALSDNVKMLVDDTFLQLPPRVCVASDAYDPLTVRVFSPPFLLGGDSSCDASCHMSMGQTNTDSINTDRNLISVRIAEARKTARIHRFKENVAVRRIQAFWKSRKLVAIVGYKHFVDSSTGVPEFQPGTGKMDQAWDAAWDVLRRDHLLQLRHYSLVDECPAEVANLRLETIREVGGFSSLPSVGTWLTHIDYNIDGCADDDTASSDNMEAGSDMPPCALCGGSLELEPDAADACDKCGVPHHSRCLHFVWHPIEPYRLCKVCFVHSYQATEEHAEFQFDDGDNVMSKVPELAAERGTHDAHEAWDEKQTGEYIMDLLSAYKAEKARVHAYKSLERGINYAAARCPETNRPWLFKLLESAKAGLEEELRQAHKASSSSIECIHQS